MLHYLCIYRVVPHKENSWVFLRVHRLRSNWDILFPRWVDCESFTLFLCEAPHWVDCRLFTLLLYKAFRMDLELFISSYICIYIYTWCTSYSVDYESFIPYIYDTYLLSELWIAHPYLIIICVSYQMNYGSFTLTYTTHPWWVDCGFFTHLTNYVEFSYKVRL